MVALTPNKAEAGIATIVYICTFVTILFPTTQGMGGEFVHESLHAALRADTILPSPIAHHATIPMRFAFPCGPGSPKAST